MTYKTHRVFSIAIATTFLKFNFYPSLYINGNATVDTVEGIAADAVFIGVIILGGMLPDIDNADSRIRRKLRRLDNNKNALPQTNPYQYRHRESFTHWPLSWILIIGALTGICLTSPLLKPLIPYYISGLSAGVFGHFLLDLLNPGGIMLLAPFYSTKFKLVKIPVGSSKETYFFWGMFVLAAVLMFIYLNNVVNMMPAMILGLWIISDFFMMTLRSSVHGIFRFRIF